MFCLAPFTSFLRSIKRIVQVEIRGESQRHGYASSTTQIEPFPQGTARGQPTFVFNPVLVHVQYSLSRHVLYRIVYLFTSISQKESFKVK